MTALRFLRALLPSWRFFDRTSAPPRLFLLRDSAWRALDEEPRAWHTPLFAPAGNLYLAYHAVVTQLVDALGELDLASEAPADGVERDPQVTGLVEYELVTRIAREHAATQWKIVVDGEDYIVSPPLVAERAT